MGLRCWQCSVEPTGQADVTGIGDVERTFVPTGWPGSPDGHEHAVEPPTPEALLGRADRMRETRLRDLAR